MQACDVLIKNALVFDGYGNAPRLEDVAVKGGLIIARDSKLEMDAAEVVDADGYWLMPGLLDIHTHLDLEVELNPGLGEAVRHGTTTVLVGNCSLGTAFGAQNTHGEEPIVDCFTRVENVPKPVLQKCASAMTWDNTEDYLRHFDDIALGPNVAAFLPHSMLRVEVMGVEDSISRKPTEAEKERMLALLRDAAQRSGAALLVVTHDERVRGQLDREFELEQRA